MARKKPAGRLGVDGAVWLTVDGENFGGKDRIELLHQVAEQGSITHAAKAVGLSYKAAWDAIDRMNTLAGEPVVARSAGGRGGGRTSLTPRGLRLVERFVQIDEVHRRFLKLLDDGSIDLARDFSVLRTLNLKTSASNRFVGTVSALRAGAVNDEVELSLPGGARIVAVVTHESARELDLRVGMTAFALLNATSVILAAGLEGAKVSARNQLPGVVAAVRPGAVNAEVVLELDGGGQITASVAQASLDEQTFARGARASAIFKASSVILAVTA